MRSEVAQIEEAVEQWSRYWPGIGLMGRCPSSGKGALRCATSLGRSLGVQSLKTVGRWCLQIFKGTSPLEHSEFSKSHPLNILGKLS